MQSPLRSSYPPPAIAPLAKARPKAEPANYLLNDFGTRAEPDGIAPRDWAAYVTVYDVRADVELEIEVQLPASRGADLDTVRVLACGHGDEWADVTSQHGQDVTCGALWGFLHSPDMRRRFEAAWDECRECWEVWQGEDLAKGIRGARL